MKQFKSLLFIACVALSFTACSDDPKTPMPEGEFIENVSNGGDIAGFYLLNEGNMGSNKCTLDYFDYKTKCYIRNIYAERNPQIIMELGDTGNDIAVYNDRLYIVVQGSNKVEVLNAANAIRIGQVDISSPRSLAFDGNNMYVSSYVGGENGCGSVVRVDTSSLQITGTVSAGLCPEEIVITDGKLYVANSTDMNGTYDDTITVIDLNTFSPLHPITAAINMDNLRLDRFGNMWATSRGNYYDIPGCIILLQKVNGEYKTVNKYPVPCTGLTINDATMYYYAVTYDANWNATNSFEAATLSTSGMATPHNFITDGTESSIMSPTCIAIQPSNGDILVTDAKNYVSSGELRCYSPVGQLQWKATTGDIPGHIAFVKK